MKNKFLKFLLNKWTLIIAGVLIIAIAGTVTALNWNNWFGGSEDEEASAGTVSKDLFWNVDRFDYIYYDSIINPERRQRDKNDGTYHVLFCNLTQQGRAVNRRVKNDTIVAKIDMYTLMGLKFDDDGVVVDVIPAEEMGYKLSTARVYVNGEVQEGQPVPLNTSERGDGIQINLDIPSTVPVYDISGSSGDIGVKLTGGFSDGDCLFVVSDKNDKMAYVLVSERNIIGTIYYNRYRKWDSKFGSTSRTPNADGLYEFELAYDAKVETFYTKEVDIANSIDKTAGKAFGLELDDQDPHLITGYLTTKDVTKGSIVASYYNVVSVDDEKILTRYTGTPTSPLFGKELTYSLARNYKVMDVTDIDGSVFGAWTDVRPGDKVQCYLNARNKICFIHVVGSRTVGVDLYWSVSRKWSGNAKTGTWTRKPEADGRYVFSVIAKNKPGVVQQVWTRDAKLAEEIDKNYAAPVFGLKLNGSEIIKHYTVAQVVGGNSVASYYTIESMKGNNVNFVYPSSGATAHALISSNPIVINTQNKCKYDTLNVGDKVHSILGPMGEIAVVYIINKAPVPVKTAYCAHCNQNVTWYKYTGGTCNIDGRHFVMTEDQESIGTETSFIVGSGNTVYKHTDKEVVLDLAGHKISSEFRAISVTTFNSLYVMDSVGGGSIRSTCTQYTDNGWAVLMGDGAKLTLKGGTIDMSGVVQTGCSGPCVYAAPGCTINMYDGAVINGSISNYGTASTLSGKSITGGAIGGSVQLSGKATRTKKDADGNVTDKVELGGAILNMYGGTINGGRTQGPGNGTGGNINVASGATFNMYGGTVSNGTTEGSGGNVFLAGTMNVSGSSKITGAGGTLFVGPSGKLNVGDLAADSNIVIDKSPSGVFASNLADADAAKAHFTTKSSDYQIISDNTAKTLAIAYVGHAHAVSGAAASGEDDKVLYEPLTQSIVNGTFSNGLPTSGNYFLAEDIVVKNQSTEKGDVNLCLNGHTVRYDVPENSEYHGSSRFLLAGYNNTIEESTTNICDCAGGGKMIKTDAKASALGAMFFVYARHKYTLNIYGGTFDASGINNTSNGGLMHVVGTATVNINGGTFIGAVNAAKGNILSATDEYATLNINGGEFKVNPGTQIASGSIVIENNRTTLSGNPQIDGTNGTSLFVANGKKINLNNLDPAAKIYVNVGGGGVFTNGGTEYKNNFIAPEGSEINAKAEGLYIAYVGHVHCACGQSLSGAADIANHTAHTQVYYEPLTQQKVKIGDNKYAMPAAGSYFLAEDITINEQIFNNGDIDICFNGHTINVVSEGSTANRLYLLGGTAPANMANPGTKTATVNFCDCKDGGGVVRTDATYAGSGALLQVNGTHSVTTNFFGGTFDASGVNSTGNGGIRLTTGTANIYGGKFIGAKTAKSGNIIYIDYGPTLNIYGGTFENTAGTTAETAGTEGINVTGSGTVKLYGNTKIEGANGVGIAVTNGKPLVVDPAFNGSVNITVPGAGVFAKIAGQNAADYKDMFKPNDVANCTYRANGDTLEFFFSGHAHAKTGKTASGEDDTVYFQPITQASIDAAGGAMPSVGNFYLEEDVVVKAQGYNTGDINLCYNGHTITINSNGSDGSRIYMLGYTAPDSMTEAGAKSAEVNFCDCKGNGGMIKTDPASKAGGSMIRIMGQHKVTLNFYDGVYDATGIKTTSNGAILWISAPATGIDAAVVNVKGGHYIGGTAELGGVFYLDSYKTSINIEDGVIESGTANKGGNIGTYGAVTVTGGTIKDGIAAKAEDDKEHNGGNIYAGLYGKIIVKGGNITGGTATNGGNVYVDGTNASASFADATITGGSTIPLSEEIGGNGDNIYIAGVKATLGGDMVFDGVDSDKIDIYLAATTAKLTVNSLGDDVKVNVATGYSGVFAPDAASQADKFPSNSKTKVSVTGSDLSAVSGGHVHCACGQAVNGAFALADHTTHTAVYYQALTQSVITDTYKGTMPTSGDWYLAEDVSVTAQANPSDNLNLCYNGHTVTFDVPENSASHGSSRIFMLGRGKAVTESTVNFCDCKTGGGMKKIDAQSSAIGSLLFIYPQHHVTVNFFGGIYDASGITTSKQGGLMQQSPPAAADSSTGSSEVNIYGGTFIGAKGGVSGAGNIINQIGGKLNIYGGIFKNNAAPASGAYGINIPSGTVKVSGAVVADGINGAYIKLGNGAKLAVSDLADDAEICVVPTADGIFATGAAQYIDKFTTVSGYNITATGNDLRIDAVS